MKVCTLWVTLTKPDSSKISSNVISIDLILVWNKFIFGGINYTSFIWPIAFLEAWITSKSIHTRFLFIFKWSPLKIFVTFFIQNFMILYFCVCDFLIFFKIFSWFLRQQDFFKCFSLCIFELMLNKAVNQIYLSISMHSK